MEKIISVKVVRLRKLFVPVVWAMWPKKSGKSTQENGTSSSS